MPGTRPGMTAIGHCFAGRQRHTVLMTKTRKYTAGEVRRLRLVEDFLPSPDDLVVRDDNVKVTLQLSRRCVDYFKRAAKTRRVPYRRMIRA
jgi:enoyl-CoA hydratase/carnithine racemase